MAAIKGPAIFLAQFSGDTAPFDTLEGMAKWAADIFGARHKRFSKPVYDNRSRQPICLDKYAKGD